MLYQIKLQSIYLQLRSKVYIFWFQKNEVHLQKDAAKVRKSPRKRRRMQKGGPMTKGTVQGNPILNKEAREDQVENWISLVILFSRVFSHYKRFTTNPILVKGVPQFSDVDGSDNEDYAPPRYQFKIRFFIRFITKLLVGLNLEYEWYSKVSVSLSMYLF